MLEDVRITTLDNGMRVVTDADPGGESVAVGVWVGVGGRHEPAALSGASHFLEHMVFKGTQRRSAKALTQAIEGRGGHLNAFTQEDSTCFFARVPYEQITRAVDVLADMLRNARLSSTDVERERAVVIEEIRMVRDQPQQLVQEMAMEAVWPRHPLGRPLAGSERSIARIDREALAAFRMRHYTSVNTVFAFAGRLSHEACVEAVARGVGDMSRGRMRPPKPVRHDLPQMACLECLREVEQTQVVAAWRTFGRHDSRRHALRVFNAVMGENMSSRLFQVLRERNGLAYSVQSGYQLFDETGMFSVGMGLESGRMARALTLLKRELRRIRERPPSALELKRARDFLLGQFRLGMESVGNRMFWLGENLVNYGRVPDPESVAEDIRAVAAEAVSAVAREVLDEERLSLVVIAPRDETVDADAGRWRLVESWK